MHKQMKIILAASVAGVLIVGLAVATPSSGVLLNNFLSNGTVETDVNVRAHVALPATAGNSSGEHDAWSAQVETEGPSNFSVQDAVFAPGGFTGWHTHPGILMLTLIEGSIEWYDSNCGKHLYNAGDSWTEGTSLHYVRVIGSANAHFVTAYITPKGQPKRIDKPTPACAVPLGLI
jgi:quercetin dioxygenase-like cupin family protein